MVSRSSRDKIFSQVLQLLGNICSLKVSLSKLSNSCTALSFRVCIVGKVFGLLINILSGAFDNCVAFKSILKAVSTIESFFSKASNGIKCIFCNISNGINCIFSSISHFFIKIFNCISKYVEETLGLSEINDDGWLEVYVHIGNVVVCTLNPLTGIVEATIDAIA